MSATRLLDENERATALLASHSCIVQAPAGSGKTELLVLRFLNLLAYANRPEEVLAITFTRKAANEMRKRVIDYLLTADSGDSDSPTETGKTLQKVLQRNQDFNWNIVENPNRLRILTMDGLLKSLASRAPLSSANGMIPNPTEHTRGLYESAALEAIQHLEHGNQEHSQVATLLDHLDGNILKLRKLLVSMLQKRDQWLRHVAAMGEGSASRQKLEDFWRIHINYIIQQVFNHLPELDWPRLNEALNYSAENLERPLIYEDKNQQDPQLWSPDRWRHFANLLTTKAGWRVKPNKRDGFPSDKKEETPAHVKNIQQAIEVLRNHDVDFGHLRELIQLPDHQFSSQQWKLIRSSNSVLRLAVAELQLLFRQRGQSDFIEVALNGINALGDDESPADIALLLDYQIRHILVDEFQDTSWSQLELLYKLTWGWQPDDGRTLFLVGDPMQSIYRFRKAEVGIFLKTWHQGLGNIELVPIRLETNFRSKSSIINWINQTFSQCFAKRADPVTTSITYHTSRAFSDDNQTDSICWHPLVNPNELDEAEKILNIIRQTQVSQPNHSIAILARSRSNLAVTLRHLKSAGIAVNAKEIDSLQSRQEIQDLLSLCRALIHPGDDLAWIGLLRSPCCGVTLPVLTMLCSSGQSIIETLHDSEIIDQLSDEDKLRVTHLARCLDTSYKLRGDEPFSHWAKDCWHRLGLPLPLTQQQHLNTTSFFKLLDNLGPLIPGIGEIEDRLERLWSESVEQSDSVQAMTIHRAKGLEWDTVILPALQKGSRVDDNEILLWQEFTEQGYEDVILQAPLPSKSEESPDHKYTYLKQLENNKGRQESIRLLYVACSRAKSHLHLIATIDLNDDGDFIKPAKHTFAEMLWHDLEEHLLATAVAPLKTELEETPSAIQLSRLPLQLIPTDPSEIQVSNSIEQIEFSWAGEKARRIGTITHLLLHRIAMAKPVKWSITSIENAKPWIQSMLRRQGLVDHELKLASAHISELLSEAISDHRFQWIIDPHHLHRQFEWAVTHQVGAETVNLVMDCSFVDKNDGKRWIIDFKTGSHSGGSVEAFLDNEVLRYRGQLENYAKALATERSEEINLGLYYPAFGGWRNWLSERSPTPKL